MNKQKVKKIFEIFTFQNKNPTTELNYSNGFQLLVAVILSAQATDISVNLATKKLFDIVESPKDMVNLGKEQLESYIKSIGLYHSKARYIIETSVTLLEKFDSIVPKTREQLESLAGVGRKTANVILNSLYGEPVIAVDTHVARVSRRIGLASSTDIVKLEMELYKIIPKVFLNNAHNQLVLHGRYICKAIRPQCSDCIISEYCDFVNVKNLDKSKNL